MTGVKLFAHRFTQFFRVEVLLVVLVVELLDAGAELPLKGLQALLPLFGNLDFPDLLGPVVALV